MKKNNFVRFAVAGLIAAGSGFAPAIAQAQGTVVRRDTVVTVRKDTVVHVRKDTAVVTTTVTTNEQMPAGSESIGASLARMPNYKTLTALLNEAHLMPSLRGAAPMTLFAPTDAAFAKISPEDMAALRADTLKLRDFLLNMMVSGKIDTQQILTMKTATTMRGTRIRFGYENGHPEVNDQPIVQPGMLASNGFIYGISGVIGMSGEK
ncbi:MAG: fasciclin domain-containing protein [Gemmatimonadaceae bacterium]